MPTELKTFNRGKLRRLVEAGRVISRSTYHFDDILGEQRGDKPMPVRMMPAEPGFIRQQGTIYLRPDDFTTKSGCAYTNGNDAVVTLHVHSNSNYTLEIVDAQR